MKIELKKEMKFGTEYLYPTNEAATYFCELLGVKTLPRNRLITIAKLGFKIEIEGSGDEVITFNR